MGADAALIRPLTDEVFIDGNVDAIDELLADGFVSHDPPPEMPPTKESAKQLAAMVMAGFSNRKMEFDEVVETTDGRTVDNWAMRATHTGEAFGLPPSNQDIVVRGIELFRCEGGKIVEHWAAVDMSDVFMKAGPPPA
jgi:predicted SnoaL-like aldol condensation-catalyzing enzyme